jgi:glycine/D-amino acid oxidase-like deaminating enzyme
LIKEKSIDCEFVAQLGVRAIYSDYHLSKLRSNLQIVREKSPDLADRMKLVTDPNELAALHIPSAIGAVVTNIAARMWPYKFVAQILSDLLTKPLSSGKTFNLQTLTPVTAISPAHAEGVHIATARGIILAKKVVLATNAYTSHLLPNFADLIVPCRGQMSALIPPASLSTEDNRLKTSFGFLGDGMDDYLVQRPTARGGHLMFGGGRNMGGRTIGVTDDSVVEEDTSQYLRRRLIDALALPKEESGKGGLEASHIWTGIMGFSRDDKPWVGRVPGEKDGIYMAAGFTGHGMPNTWLCGKAVARMVLDESDQDEGDLQNLIEKETGVPKSYWASKERVERAMREHEDVELCDWEEATRGL